MYSAAAPEVFFSKLDYQTGGPEAPPYSFRDLDPLQAPHWSVRVRTAENPQCLLDAAVEKSDFKNNTQLSNSSGTSEQGKTSDYNLFHQLKSAPSDSLTYRLALCVCLVNYYYGGLRAVGHLWQEFVLELRYRWENNHVICGLAGGAPDLRCCLLHQKFQMLNCCIERKKARDESHKVPEGKEKEHRVSGACQKSRQGPECATSASSSTREMSQGKSWDSWSDSEEEFFECLSDQGETEATQAEGRAEGRLHPHNNMTLLNSAEPLYVPVTQAANPGCVLEDFVRWYSPRDYVEEEVVDEKVNTMVMGTLSPRMKIPGNMWVEAWETARVTPARRQKILFDDTKEAEKVLHYMAMQKPADLARHLLPCILHATILKEEESAEDIPSVQKTIQQATVQASKLLQSPNQDYKKLEDFINQLLSMETVITQARSLKAKFSVPEDDSGEAADELKKFVSSLLEEPEVVVTGAGQGLAGSIIHGLFISAQRVTLTLPPCPSHVLLSVSCIQSCICHL
ncbi:rab3 GTPase-activating protein catalytic subunit-like [Astatotilapia calliptera]|uniref:rab3 GTPase-activating protein catalytic subunit-like n=1 Tax=Astatotilapia calliptera TaxID=8154 RepID=UPI000E409AC0|nr:rab3 GTPase-activating protein catalytic subunit-like [Astatotilapia calliptera]